MYEQPGSIDPWYITGFTDGEGCFSLFLNTESRLRKNGSVSVYTYWVTVFRIHLRGDDIKVLKEIQTYFKCGSVGLFNSSSQKKLDNFIGNAAYHVKSRQEIVEHIIPHFDKYTLRAKKLDTYKLWREAVLILYKSDKRRVSRFAPQELTDDEQSRLLDIKTKLADTQVLGQKKRSLNSIQNKNKGKVIINKT